MGYGFTITRERQKLLCVSGSTRERPTGVGALELTRERQKLLFVSGATRERQTLVCVSGTATGIVAGHLVSKARLHRELRDHRDSSYRSHGRESQSRDQRGRDRYAT